MFFFSISEARNTKVGKREERNDRLHNANSLLTLIVFSYRQQRDDKEAHNKKKFKKKRTKSLNVKNVSNLMNKPQSRLMAESNNRND